MSFFESFLKMMSDGGPFMYIIFTVWIFGIVLCIVKFIDLRRLNVDERQLYQAIKNHVVSNDVETAINICSSSNAIIPRIMKAGLKRANMNKEHISDALEAKYMELAPRITALITFITLAANISTLLGLLGTIDGLIDSFQSLATVDPSQKSQVLAQGISKAMNTTLLGLVSAISIMVANTYISAKANGMLSKVDEYSYKLLDLLSCKKKVRKVETPR